MCGKGGVMGDVSGADNGWLAKVLAGDLVTCGVLTLAHNLPADEWYALARSVERIRAGMPAADVLAALWQRREEEYPQSG